MKGAKNPAHKMARYKNSSIFAIRGSPKSTPTSSIFATVEGFSMAKNEPVAPFLYGKK